EDVAFSVEDKVRIAHALDSLGIDYIEGGWPGSNPRDVEFFKRMRTEKLKNAKLTAFGSTRRRGIVPSKDANIRALLRAKTEVVTIFGKCWKFHVQKALGVSLQENLDMINDSVAYLKKRVGTVFFDGEHFFDGFKDDPEYALKALEAASSAGADALVLCDTNGGTLPQEVAGIVVAVRAEGFVELGIHAHNDSETGVANTLMAVELGVRHVQGTINGVGERCGNADLISVIPALTHKMGLKSVSPKSMKMLGETSRFVRELANLPQRKHQPYVGSAAFAHKGGIHVSAVQKNSKTYEHMDPTLVGNRQRVLVSDLSGRANLLYKAKEYGVNLDAKDKSTKKLLTQLKELENQGFQYEGAEASFELLMQKALGKKTDYFTLLGFRVVEEKKLNSPHTEATIKLEVGGEVEHTAAEGNGPVNALDKALRKALERFYPALKDVRLIDFKVRVLEGTAGTSARVRVLVESGDKKEKWGTVGVSENIIEASWQALVDSLVYKLYKDGRKRSARI
ncbi:MAG: citramalate synthase, partial [Proteobacteria bacterium]|nr:citramalate synthase [Pseudomonadota bacterium]